MTKKEYAEYQERVAEFFSHGLNNLSQTETCRKAFFSWRPCQCCGDPHGGDRYECNGYNEKTDEVEEYDCICADCVYYAEYGQLDDMTMMEIEKSEE